MAESITSPCPCSLQESALPSPSTHTAHAPIDGKDGKRESHEDSRKDSLVSQGEGLIRQASRVHANAENGAEENADAAQKEVGVECLTQRPFLLRRKKRRGANIFSSCHESFPKKLSRLFSCFDKRSHSPAENKRKSP